MTNLTITFLKIIMNKIVYLFLLLLFFVLVFISACKTDINALNERGETKLHLAATRSKDPEKFLL